MARTRKNPVEITEEAQESPEAVLIMVPNVWADGVKWFMHDVVVLNDAAILVENKQAKVTRDDATHAKNSDGNREAI